MAVSRPSPSGARIGRALELLHAPGPRRLRDRNRLAGWPPADRPARRATRTPVPSRAPVPLGRHAERACLAESVQPCAACADWDRYDAEAAEQGDEAEAAEQGGAGGGEQGGEESEECQ